MIVPPRYHRLALPATALALIALAIAEMTVGDMPLSPGRVWSGLWRHDELATTIVWNIRLPRLIAAVLVGSALAASGVVMQAYFRNSLASPGLLGVSSGGSAGAVVAIAAGWSTLSLWFMPRAAMVGAFAATVTVLVLARRGASTERLLLAGIALNAFLGAITGFVLSRLYERSSQALFWLLGGLEDRTWEHILITLPIPLAALALLPVGRAMDLFSLGEDEAQSLGVDGRALRRRLLTIATVLTASATAVAGIVGFVGLVVPHMLRLLVGPEHRRLIPLALVGGAVFVLGCDLVGRVAGGLRLGIVTSLIGGPFFLWLLRKHR